LLALGLLVLFLPWVQVLADLDVLEGEVVLVILVDLVLVVVDEEDLVILVDLVLVAVLVALAFLADLHAYLLDLALVVVLVALAFLADPDVQETLALPFLGVQ